jgi:hypothetical protein
VPVEGQLLPNQELKPLYETVIWLWVYRSHKKDPGDLAAERVMNRCGASSYPQLLFLDGATWAILAESGRTVDLFKQAADRAIRAMKKPDPAMGPMLADMNKAKALLAAGKKDEATAVLKAFKEKDPGEFFAEARELMGLVKPATEHDLDDSDADRRADALECRLVKKVPVSDEAARLLKDPDGEVRLRAVIYVGALAPDRLKIGDLLADPLDGVKFAALDAVRSNPDPKHGISAAEAWRALEDKKIQSGNPNVLRMKLAEIMGICGGDEAVPLLGDFAARHEILNGTTGVCVRSLGQLGKRKAKGAPQALLKSFPDAVTPEMEKNKQAVYCVNLAKAVHAALTEACGESPAAFPASWNEEGRKALIDAWSRRLP